MTKIQTVRFPRRFDLLKPIYIDDLVRLGRNFDGGYVIPKRLISHSSYLLSMGLSNDWSFEKSWKEKNPQVRIEAYDHTLTTRWLRKLAIHELRKLLEFRGGFRDLVDSIQNYLDYLRFFHGESVHYRKRVFGYKASNLDATPGDIFFKIPEGSSVFVKMDIEGSEYRVLDQFKPYKNDISGFAIEFHDIVPFEEKFLSQLEWLLDGFHICHIHINNCGGVSPAGIPEVLELSLINKKLVKEPISRIDSPFIELDMPCCPAVDDYRIEFWPENGD